MANPTYKSPEIEAVLTSMTGVHRPTQIRNDKCVFCKRSALSFRDALSRKEYSISGLCQDCQDEVFGVDMDALIENVNAQID